MSNETTQKNIHVKKVLANRCNGDIIDKLIVCPSTDENAVSYIRTDLIPDVTDLRRQLAALKEFAIKINQKVWECGDVDGDEMQELGEALGIIEPHNVTQEDHDKGQYTDWNIGDPMFQLTDWMLTDTAAMPAPSKAEVAREFMEAAMERWFGMPDYTFRDLVDALKEEIKEWEDAESK